MRKVLFLGVIVCAWVATCFAGSMTWVSYEAREFGGGQWEYTYEVANTGLLVDNQPGSVFQSCGDHGRILVECVGPNRLAAGAGLAG